MKNGLLTHPRRSFTVTHKLAVLAEFRASDNFKTSGQDTQDRSEKSSLLDF